MKRVSSLPDVAVLHGVVIETTTATLPMEWIVYHPLGDPATLGGSALPSRHDASQYWDISFHPVAAKARADLTLNWPDSAGFETEARIFRLGVGVWSQAGVFDSADVSGDPNTVTHRDVSTFSPFAVGDKDSLLTLWILH
ncbi:MAG: hypothetical protein V2A74_02885 [bacterium]